MLRLLRWMFLAVLCVTGLYYVVCIAGLVTYRWMDPTETNVMFQRRVEAVLSHSRYSAHNTFVPLSQIALDLQHAVIAAEDGRFYEHKGIDWIEVEKVMDAELDEGQLSRGASTITQQLVKNLFFTTHRSLFRKGVELTLAPVSEVILKKHRILELYLNVVEWGPEVWGAEEAARHWYKIHASALNREQAARLAAILPAPRRRTPAMMNRYSAAILRRMTQMGW